MSWGWQGATRFRRYGREPVPEPAISSKEQLGDYTAQPLESREENVP